MSWHGMACPVLSVATAATTAAEMQCNLFVFDSKFLLSSTFSLILSFSLSLFLVISIHSLWAITLFRYSTLLYWLWPGYHIRYTLLYTIYYIRTHSNDHKKTHNHSILFESYISYPIPILILSSISLLLYY